MPAIALSALRVSESRIMSASSWLNMAALISTLLASSATAAPVIFRANILTVSACVVSGFAITSSNTGASSDNYLIRSVLNIFMIYTPKACY